MAAKEKPAVKAKAANKTKPEVNRSQAVRDYLAKNANAKVADIKAGLAKDGIQVSDTLISKVKYKKSTGKKRGRPAKSIAKTGKPKSNINRSQAIRDYLATNRKASADEIKEALAKKGIEASDSLIKKLRYEKPKGKRGKKRGRPAGTTTTAESVSVDSLVAAKKMVNQLGGIAAAEKAIGILKRLG